MKKILLTSTFAFFLLSFNLVIAQPITFSKVYYDSTTGTSGRAVIPAYDSGYLIAGQHNFSSALIFKIDSAGNHLWSKEIGTSYNELFNAIIPTHDSCYVLAGNMRDTIINVDNLFCVKVNSIGDTLWSKSISMGANAQTVFSITETFDHGFVMTGYIGNIGPPYSYIVTAKIDSAGGLEWSNTLTSANYENYGFSIKQVPDSGYVLCGYAETHNGTFQGDAVLIKLSSAGDIVWANKYNNNPPAFFTGQDVLIAPNGFMCMFSTSNKIALVKTDFSGNVIWSSSIPAGGFGSFPASQPKIHATSDGGFILVNGTGDSFGNNNNTELLKVDSSGNLLWAQDLDLNAIEALQTKDSGFIILGNGPLIGAAPHMTTPLPQIGILKTDSLGNGSGCANPDGSTSSVDSVIGTIIFATQISGSVLTDVFPVVNAITLVVDSGCVYRSGGVHELSVADFTISPNPTSSLFVVSSSDFGDKNSRIEIFSTLGEKVYSSPLNLKLQTLNPKLPAGIYFVQVGDEKKRVVKKLVVE